MPPTSPSLVSSIRLGSAAPPTWVRPIAAVAPLGSAAPAQFLDLPHSTELGELSQLAAQVLADPLATARLCDRVAQLMQQDLRSQREWHQAGRQG